MSVDLDKLEAAAKAATPGTWHTNDDDWWVVRSAAGRLICMTSQGDFDKEYIAAASPATMLALVTEIHLLRELIEVARCSTKDFYEALAAVDAKAGEA